MKKITLLVIVAFVIMMSGCNKDVKYVIKGIAEDYPNGTKVYLMMREKPNWIAVDSAIVMEGRFIMSGQVYPGFLGYIGVDDNRTMIVVESGEIVIDLKDGNPHGTTSNEELTTFNHSMEILEDQMSMIIVKRDSLDNQDTATFAKLNARLEELNQEKMQMLANVIKENITNPLGVGLYCMYNSAFAEDIDFLLTLSQLIPEEYLEQAYVSKVLENVSIISCTSVGNNFTDLLMTTREGNEVRLDSLIKRNKYVLLDFWASWCAPCRQSLPGIRMLYENCKDKGLCIVGISLDEDKEAWENALEKYEMDWLQVGEMLGWESEHAATYGVRAIPATVLIDSTGTIIGRNLEANEVAALFDK